MDKIMELQIVNKDLAVQLKNKGFDSPCEYIYHEGCEDFFVTSECRLQKEDVYAPTQALVCKWLRDVHNIIVLPLYRIRDNKYLKYIKGVVINEKDSFNTYEQAEEAGIIEALKLI